MINGRTRTQRKIINGRNKPEKGRSKIEKEPGERLRIVLKGLNLYQEKVKFFSLFIELQCREYLFEF